MRECLYRLCGVRNRNYYYSNGTQEVVLQLPNTLDNCWNNRLSLHCNRFLPIHCLLFYKLELLYQEGVFQGFFHKCFLIREHSNWRLLCKWQDKLFSAMMTKGKSSSSNTATSLIFAMTLLRITVNMADNRCKIT